MRKKQRVTYMTLWHVTHKSHIDGILKLGIDPCVSTGKEKRSWFTRWWGLAYVFFHISTKKHWPVWDMVAFRVKIRTDQLTHFNRTVYTSKRVAKTTHYLTSDKILSAIERQREYKRSYRPQPAVTFVENDLDWLKGD